MRTREEHLEWSKEVARHDLDRGGVADAIATMCTCLAQHPDFVGVVDKMMPLGLFYAVHNDLEGARRFVEGFR